MKEKKLVEIQTHFLDEKIMLIYYNHNMCLSGICLNPFWSAFRQRFFR